jgi:hypothetical protein
MELVAQLGAGLVLLGGAFAPNARAEPLSIPGTSVAMTAPAGFTVSHDFTGLENTETGSSILIAELPAEAYTELAELFTHADDLVARFAPQGVRITGTRELAVDGARVPFAVGRQLAQGVEFAKYVAMFKGENTVLITFSIADSGGFSESDAEAAVRSVTLTHAPTIDEKLALQPFTFHAIAPFRVSDVLAGNAVVLTTFDGADPSGTKPVLVLTQAPTTARPGDESKFAEQLLRRMSDFADARIEEQGPTTFAGGRGHFIAAVFEARTVQQYLRVLPDGSYLRLVSRGETDAMESVAAAIIEVANSVQPK